MGMRLVRGAVVEPATGQEVPGSEFPTHPSEMFAFGEKSGNEIPNGVNSQEISQVDDRRVSRDAELSGDGVASVEAVTED